jgi:hypothetical protein
MSHHVRIGSLLVSHWQPASDSRCCSPGLRRDDGTRAENLTSLQSRVRSWIMSSLAPIVRRACTRTGLLAQSLCRPSLLHSRFSCWAGLRPWPRSMLPSRYCQMVKFCKFGLPPRPWPQAGRPGSHFLSPSRSESHRQRRQVEGCVRGPTQLEVTAVRHESDHHWDHELTGTCCAPGLCRDGARRAQSLCRPGAQGT